MSAMVCGCDNCRAILRTASFFRRADSDSGKRGCSTTSARSLTASGADSWENIEFKLRLILPNGNSESATHLCGGLGQLLRGEHHGTFSEEVPCETGHASV